MANDYFLEQIGEQIAELDADIAEIQAGLMRAKARGNDHETRQLLQGYASAKSQRRDLQIAANEHYQSLNRPATAPMTDAEFEAMSPEKMLQHPECLERIFSKSKYYSKDMWNEPDIARRVQAGIAEVQRRKAEGR